MKIPLGRIARIQGRVPMPESPARADHFSRPADVEGAVSIRRMHGQTITAKFHRGRWRALLQCGPAWLSYESDDHQTLWAEIHKDAARVAERNSR